MFNVRLKLITALYAIFTFNINDYFNITFLYFIYQKSVAANTGVITKGCSRDCTNTSLTNLGAAAVYCCNSFMCNNGNKFNFELNKFYIFCTLFFSFFKSFFV